MRIRPFPCCEDFLERAEGQKVLPVAVELVADSLTPVGAFRAAVGDNEGFLLESVEHGERWSRFSFLGRRPLATLACLSGQVAILDGALPAVVPLDGGILAAVEGLLAELASPRAPELPPLNGGLVGYFGYDVVREIERLGPPAIDDRGLPDAVVSVIGELAAFDHWRQRVTLVDNVVVPRTPSGSLDKRAATAAYEASLGRLGELAGDLGRRRDEAPVAPPDASAALAEHEVRRCVSSEQFRAAVEAAKEHISAGDAFQVVLSQRFDLDLGCDPFDVYRMLRQVNPSPYMFFLRQGGVAVVGASPEPLVQLLDGRVVSRPIAGTRRRGSTDAEDRLREAELVEHPKEVAEHVMLVDLARNDVGRVVEYGTEQVDELMVVERYSHVMHLTSQVSGKLRAGRGPIDVLRATMPAGTVSGAPKVRAMEIIDDLETTRRGPYAGVVGYVDFSGNLDTAIAIRTLVVGPDGRASVQAGAGIVADSDPAAEDRECADKAAAVLAAVAAARQLC
ncbi:MAG: anthranilate synthase component I family protein [Acidimicrobiales bacterium]